MNWLKQLLCEHSWNIEGRWVGFPQDMYWQETFTCTKCRKVVVEES